MILALNCSLPVNIKNSFFFAVDSMLNIVDFVLNLKMQLNTSIYMHAREAQNIPSKINRKSRTIFSRDSMISVS